VLTGRPAVPAREEIEQLPVDHVGPLLLADVSALRNGHTADVAGDALPSDTPRNVKNQ
jgi:hypothetical protein